MHKKSEKKMMSTIYANVINISTPENFNELVNKYRDNLIIVDFWAPWCAPCLSFAPAFESLQKDYKEKKVIFAKLNVDENGQIAEQFQITGIPTTLFIKSNKLIHRQVGAPNKAQFKQIIDFLLENNK